MGFELTARDRRRLAGVHPHLVRLVERAAAICPVRFMVVEGLRSIEQQKANFDSGASKTMNSRHLKAANGYGHAVDLCGHYDEDGDGRLDAVWNAFPKIRDAMKRASRELGIPVNWGGDWKGSWDTPHWELPWKQYPATAKVAWIADQEPAMSGRKVADLARSRTVQGSAVGVGGGLGLFADQGSDLLDQITQADQHIQAGTVVNTIIGLAILGGALWALYARWDDAGRPLPALVERLARRWFPDLYGEVA